ncbi:DUF2861 family protein [Candidatus Sororendozoicomonas aggregata]|uniref:DUF2861 family protein n=1 Tax=Candidatus Sororendozoicomonas aggregata TaxID=3073239 RepID=UPI002ED16F7F
MRFVLLLTVIFFLTFIVRQTVAADNFFRNTPLKPVYDALINKHPQLAYREFYSALLKQGRGNAIEKHCGLVGIEILRQTRCGRDTVYADVNIPPLKVVLAARSNPRQQYVYQVLIEAEHSEHPTTFTLKDAKDQLWFSGTLPTSASPVILASPEWFAPLPSGFYTLTLNKKKQYLLFVLPCNVRDWLDPWSSKGIVHLKLPDHLEGCPPVTVFQRWFGKDFATIGVPVPIKTDQDFLLPEKYPASAAGLGLSASFYYFQGGVEIELRQQISIPVSWLPEQHE